MWRRMTTSLLVLLASLLGCAGGQSDCGEGKIRDLDGRCVKKVTFPPNERRTCPDIAIAR
jgi:hypothetical protein